MPIKCLSNRNVCQRTNGNPSTLKAVVQCYLRDCEPGEHRYLEYYRNQPSTAAVIRVAAMADFRGKRFDHQYRIPEATLKRAATKLLTSKSAIVRCKTFRDLFDLVNAKL